MIFIIGTPVSEVGVQLLVGMLLRDGGEGSEETVHALMYGLEDAQRSSAALVPLSPRMRSAVRAVLKNDPPEELVELRDKLSPRAAPPPGEAM